MALAGVVLAAACSSGAEAGGPPTSGTAPESTTTTLPSSWSAIELPLERDHDRGRAEQVAVLGDGVYVVGATWLDDGSGFEPLDVDPAVWHLGDGGWALERFDEVRAKGPVQAIADIAGVGIVAAIGGRQPTAVVRRQATGSWRGETMPLPPQAVTSEITNVFGGIGGVLAVGSVTTGGEVRAAVWRRRVGGWTVETERIDPSTLRGGCTDGGAGLAVVGSIDGVVPVVARSDGGDEWTMHVLASDSDTDGGAHADACAWADDQLLVIGSVGERLTSWLAAGQGQFAAAVLPLEGSAARSEPIVAAVPGEWLVFSGGEAWRSSDAVAWDAWTGLSTDLARFDVEAVTTVADRLLLVGQREGVPVVASGPLPADAPFDATLTDAEWAQQYAGLVACDLLSPAELASLAGVDPATVRSQGVGIDEGADLALRTCLYEVEGVPVEVAFAASARYESFLVTSRGWAQGELEAVPGLGDEAVWMPGFVLVRDDPHAVAVSGLGPRDAAVAVAIALVGRLPR